MKKLTLFFKYWLPVFLWMIIIFFFSSRQRVGLAEDIKINFLIFKSFHLLEYGFLFYLTQRGLKYGSGITERYSKVAAFILVLVYAISDEIHQTFVPTREGAFRDVIIDCLGAGTIWLLLKYIQHILPKRLNNWLIDLQLL